MANGIYIAMCGAVARAHQVEAAADNVANAATPGFKAGQFAFETFLAGNSRVGFVATVDAGVDRRPGVRTSAGSVMDLTPAGEAWFTVLTPGGQVVYSRDGRVRVDGDGRLRTPAGLLLDATGQAIAIPRAGPPPVFAPQGTVLVDGVEVARLGLVRIDGDLLGAGGAAHRPGPGATVTPVESGIHVGELEGSNVCALEAMVGLVSAQRGFDFAMQAIETYRRMGQGASLGQVR